MTNSFNWILQAASITAVNLGTIPARKGSVAEAVFGIAGVVAVFIGVLSIAVGFRRVMTNSTSPDVAMVLRSGADTENMSVMLRDQARVIEDAPGILRDRQREAVSMESLVVMELPKRGSGIDANVPLRGVDQNAMMVHKKVRIVRGRNFESGRNEMIVGQAAAGEFVGLDLGATLKVGKDRWKIVGIFSAGGGIEESEIWTDSTALQFAFDRGTTLQAVIARLTTPAAFREFKDSLMNDPRVNVRIVRQSDYYADQSAMVYNLVTGLGILITSLMAVGAIFGALNTMYNAVASRTQEIATLRALGFSNGPVVISIMVESLCLALAGGLVGAAIAYFLFNGFHASTLNWQSYSQVAFTFSVTPVLICQGILCAAVIGFIGGFFPAMRAAHLPIVSGLRDN
jgi:putative ABC transport system permease protein